MSRLLSSSSALLWGLQFAFLSPVLALLLVSLFHATPADVGWVLALYNTSGFVASLLIPVWADRKRDDLRPMLVCAVLTVALAGALAATTSLPIAVIALMVLGGPAGVGSTLLFAELRHSGASTSEVMNTRAVVSFAWVAGPPLATFIMGWLGDWSVLPLLAVVGILNVVTTVILMTRRGSPAATRTDREADQPTHEPVGRARVAAIFTAFVLLQATNAAVMAIMVLYVNAGLGLPVIWGGVVLGVAALAEIPALWLMGRFSHLFSLPSLIISGCLAGVLYYVALIFIHDPITLIVAQPLNAWFFAVIAGIGMTLFQQIIPRPGLATGLFMNTRRIGAIAAGPIIAVAGIRALGYPAVFALCAIITVIAVAILIVAQSTSNRTRAGSRAVTA
jgi:SET family sugar efflux transporter-like MFS transporter